VLQVPVILTLPEHIGWLRAWLNISTNLRIKYAL